MGRRGIFLLIIGTGKSCWGLSFLVDPPDDHGLQLLTRVCDLRHWAWLWIVCGIITAASAFLRVGRDRLGFVAALPPPLVWATAYTSAVIGGDYSRGAYVAIWYLTSHVGVIMWAATVPEHSVPHTPRPARKGKAP
ncbi:hypothetical protein OG785_45825 [Streptomyces sp. NBC_00006]|uniref:hypothetical protein n=1 Tax=Streptomyces sp. NBC_00006 TaxID=2975619 RepID=UPI0022595898|nr:hypothetical protein [Streptomyces sp. NBC_00006]MCX5537708.1 hypothetical protein [Streptomyces sp. NBC_00006]MCX5537881.1 hypothetical protein [Streptomyces sp. NBC_00006]